MGVFRVEKNKNYTVMSNRHLQDRELSLKAKGLLSQMLSLPEDWDYTLRGLAAINKESVNTISTIVNELIDHGYILRQQRRAAAGQFADIDYLIFESAEDLRRYLLELEEQAQDDLGKEVKDCLEEMAKNSPCHNFCDTVETLAACGFEPCHKKRDTDSRDTDFCDANQILNNKLTNKQIDNGFIDSSLNPSIHQNQGTDPPENKELENYRLLQEQIREQIDYPVLCHDMPEQIGWIDTITEILLDAYLCDKPVIVVGNRDRPAEVVRARFRKLTALHVTYVIECMCNNHTQIHNLRAYLRAALYNAVDTVGPFYHNRVQHDLYGQK